MNNSKWNDFLTEFVMRAMTTHEDYFEPADAVRLARRCWDAIQNAELPESEKAKQVEPQKANLTELKALARTVLDFFSDDVQWIAIDANGEVWAYDLKPTIDETRSNWDNSDDDGVAWEIGAVEPPEDYTKELYRISEILSNDL